MDNNPNDRWEALGGSAGQSGQAQGVDERSYPKVFSLEFVSYAKCERV